MNRVNLWRTVWRHSDPNASDAFEISPVVRADCHIQIAGSLIEKKCHPNGDEPCRDPWIVIIGIRQIHVEQAKFVQLSHSFSGEI